MNFAEYINWIITHSENYIFCSSTVVSTQTKYYSIHHKSPFTGRHYTVLHFYLKEDNIIDFTSDLIIANTNEILMDKLDQLNKEQEALDKGEENIEDEA